MATRFSVCCVYLEHKGERSKKLLSVSESILQKINTFINYKYDPNLEAYSTTICTSCQRNLYLLDAEKSTARSSWLSKVSKIHEESVVRRGVNIVDFVQSAQSEIVNDTKENLCHHCFGIIGKNL
nr:uncharacterized protein LOC124809109 [Hydra vulgaris]